MANMNEKVQSQHTKKVVGKFGTERRAVQISDDWHWSEKRQVAVPGPGSYAMPSEFHNSAR